MRGTVISLSPIFDLYHIKVFFCENKLLQQ